MTTRKTEARVAITGDTKDFQKSIQAAARDLNRYEKKAQTAKKETKSLGDQFSKAANNVAIFSGPLDPIAGRLSAIGSGLNRFGVAGLAAATGIGALTLSMNKALSSLNEYEKRQMRLNAILEVTGNTAGMTANELEQMAIRFGDATLNSTEGGAKALVMLTRMANLTGDSFERILQTAEGASQILGIGFEQTVKNIGGALNDPIKNLNRLATSLKIEIPKSTEKTIKALAEQGRVVEAQSKVWELLGDEFRDFALQGGQLMENRVDSMGEAWDRMWERIGRTDTLTWINERIKDSVSWSTQLFNSIGQMHDPRAIVRVIQAEEHLADLRSKWGVSSILIKKAEERLAKARQDLYKEQQEREKANESKQQGILEAEVKRSNKRLEIANKEAQQTRRLSAMRFEDARGKVQRKYTDEVNALITANQNRLQATEDAIKAEFALRKTDVGLAEKLATEKKKLEDQLTKDLAAAGQYRQRELDKIDKIEEARETARLQRATRQREKLISLKSGDDGEAKLEANYQRELIYLENTEFEKEAITAAGYENREAMVKAYRLILKQNYAEDVENYKASVEQKNELDRQRLQRLAETTGQNLFTEGLSGTEGYGVSFWDRLFGTEEDFQTKQARIQSALEDSYAAIELSTMTHEQKMAAIKSAQQQATEESNKTHADLEQQVASDMWGGIQNLAKTGSKKLVAISRAANVVQLTMNAWKSASNTVSYLSDKLPPPLPQLAGAAMFGAQMIPVRQMKAQSMPQFHDGIDFVPREGTYLLDRGERVLDSRLNQDLKSFLGEGGNGGRGDTTIQMNVPYTPNSQLDSWYEENRDVIVRDIQYAMGN